MRRPTTQAFFDELKDWSERKLSILTGYLASSVRILSSITKVCYVDGFAGKGIYENGDKGSPVRAAELAKQYEVEGRKYTFHCINIEEDPANFTELQASTAQFGDIVLNLQGTFSENIDRVLSEIVGCAVVCFLDPFGIEGVEWQAVGKLVSRTEPTDLLIRFDPLTVRRMCGFLDRDSGRASQKPETLARVYGLTVEELRSLLAAPTPEERIAKAVDLYEKRLADEYARRSRTKKGFAATYVIKSLDGQPKGYMVFASAHPKAAVLMNDIVYKAEQDHQRDVAEYKASQPKQLSMFESEPTEKEIREEKVNRLIQDIWEIGRGKKLSRMDICVALWTEKWFGQISSSHINSALNAMRRPEDGRIVAATARTSDDHTVFTFRDA